ncbi:MAG: DNA polymerase III subunit delta [Tepidisphaera sp.]
MAKAAKTSGSPGPEHRVVLLYGANTFLAAEYTTQLKDKLQTAHGALDVLHFDGKEHKLADVLDECRSFGLMQQHKMVVVDSAEELVKEDNRPLVERYAEQPTEGATLVLRATKWYKGKLDDKIAAVGIMVECGDIGEAMARTWAIRRAGKRHGATLEEDAASTLIERCGDDLGRIDSELGKLAAMAVSEAGLGGAVTITGAMVNEVVGRSREESAWDWQSTLIMGHTEGAIERQRYLVNVMRESPVLLWWACMDLTRKLHAASNALKAGENERNIATALRLWGPAQGALLAKARELGPAGARRALKLAVEADAGVKSGLGDAERTLEVVAVRLTAMLRPRAAR